MVSHVSVWHGRVSLRLELLAQLSDQANSVEILNWTMIVRAVSLGVDRICDWNGQVSFRSAQTSFRDHQVKSVMVIFFSQ
jgi:hypothetical protein